MIYAQVLFFGIVPASEGLPVAMEMYDAMEEGLLDGGYEIGLICFDLRDPNPYDLETGLYVARNLGARFVIIWQILKDGLFAAKAYRTDGVLVTEKEVNIREAVSAMPEAEKPKNVSQGYFKFGREFVMGLEGKL
ncbi:MAG: hypothetical protein ACRCVN_00125 [Spirochaetia bacterium]